MSNIFVFLLVPGRIRIHTFFSESAGVGSKPGFIFKKQDWSRSEEFVNLHRLMEPCVFSYTPILLLRFRRRGERLILNTHEWKPCIMIMRLHVNPEYFASTSIAGNVVEIIRLGVYMTTCAQAVLKTVKRLNCVCCYPPLPQITSIAFWSVPLIWPAHW